VTQPFDIVQYGPNMFFLGGELDMSVDSRLREAVADAVRAGGPILFDLSALTFLDSTGLHAFLSIAKALGDDGCLLLHAPRDNVRRVLDLVRIDDITNIHVNTCPLIAHPKQTLEWVPAPDLDDRMAALRAVAAGDSG
jgi:anti-sigma B factor antagonist